MNLKSHIFLLRLMRIYAVLVEQRDHAFHLLSLIYRLVVHVPRYVEQHNYHIDPKHLMNIYGVFVEHT